MRLSHIPTNTPKATLSTIRDDNGGVKQTLDAMSRFTRQAKSDINIRSLAGSITQHLNQKDFVGEIKAIQNYVKNNIRYIRDIRGVETVQQPIATLQLGYGDCDDKSTLTAALLESIGHPTRFVACGFKGSDLSHVFVQTKIGAKWVSVETTEPVQLGWTPPNMKAFLIVNN